MNRMRVVASCGRACPGDGVEQPVPAVRSVQPGRAGHPVALGGKDHRPLGALVDVQHLVTEAGAEDRGHGDVGRGGDLAVRHHPDELVGHGAVEQGDHQAHPGQQVFHQQGVAQRDDVSTDQHRDRAHLVGQGRPQLRIGRLQEVAHLVTPAAQLGARSPGHLDVPDHHRPQRRFTRTYGVKPMYLVSRYSSMPSVPPSLPSPDCLTPPKGAATSESTPRLTPTIPVSSASATRSARSRFWV